MVKASDLHEGFIQKPVMEQLGKIVDSESLREYVCQSKFNPFDTVTTDDGKQFRLSAGQAQKLMNFVANTRMPYRRNMIYNIQDSFGFGNLLKLVLK
jgi:hypothetical protein